jgi:hypothetical protein
METKTFKRFLLFGFPEYYPSGGLGDVDGEFDDLNDAIAAAVDSFREYRYVFDCQTRQIVWDWEDVQKNRSEA